VAGLGVLLYTLFHPGLRANGDPGVAELDEPAPADSHEFAGQPADS
jgi:hypothetical protein